MSSPCQDCIKRKPGCHGVCVDYESYKLAKAEQAKLIAEEAKRDSTYRQIRRRSK